MRTCGLCVLVLGLAFGVARAQEKFEPPAHQELRTLMKDVLAAYNKNDVDKLVTYLDDDVVITWQNGMVSKTPEGVKKFFAEMTRGPNKVVEKSTIAPTVDELTHLYANDTVGVAFGSSEDYYKLTSGKEFTQQTRWSATVVKKGDQWKVASVHISVNMFDNPVLRIAVQRTAWTVGGIAGIVALLVGLGGGWFVGRKRKTA